MEGDVKRIRRYLAVAGMAILMFATLWTVRETFGGDHLGADFGDFSGSSDYDFSGYDSGSDYGSDSWDSGSYDYGGSSYGGYSGYGYSGGYGGGYYDEPGGGIGGSIVMVLVVWIVLLAAIYIIRKNKRGDASSGTSTVNQRPVTYTDRSQSLKTAESELTPMSQYSQLDPLFDANALAEKVGNWYVQMQAAWTRKDLSQLRPYLSDTLYAQMERQVQQYITNHRTNYVENISVLGVRLRGYRQTGDVDEIIAEVTTRITDYTVDDKTGEVIKGSKTAERFMTYEYSLTRTKGQMTEEQEEMTTITCPHCAAPVNINESAVCPYCGSVLTVAEHGWVISGIKGISQQTR